MLGFTQPPASGNWTFGDAENEYPHSTPAEYIRLRDPDALEELLLQAERNGAASFNVAAFKRASPAKELKWLLGELDSAFGQVERAFDHLKEAKKEAGDVRGRLLPYKRPNTQRLDLKKIRLDNARQHAMGVGLLQYKLQIDLLEAVQNKLREARAALEAQLPHFQHVDIQLLAKHNLQCVKNLLSESSLYVEHMARIEPEEYARLTRWISLQWERFTSLRDRFPRK